MWCVWPARQEREGRSWQDYLTRFGRSDVTAKTTTRPPLTKPQDDLDLFRWTQPVGVVDGSRGDRVAEAVTRTRTRMPPGGGRQKTRSDDEMAVGPIGMSAEITWISGRRKRRRRSLAAGPAWRASRFVPTRSREESEEAGKKERRRGVRDRC